MRKLISIYANEKNNKNIFDSNIKMLLAFVYVAAVVAIVIASVAVVIALLVVVVVVAIAVVIWPTIWRLTHRN